jgi:hypothetical protein
MLLALDSADPPAEHDGMYPRGALFAANYSVPVLWLSLFDTDGLVTWPGIRGSSYLYSNGSRLEPFGTIGLVTAGYTWAGQAQWEEEEASELEPTDEQERRRHQAEQLKRARAAQ